MEGGVGASLLTPKCIQSRSTTTSVYDQPVIVSDGCNIVLDEKIDFPNDKNNLIPMEYTTEWNSPIWLQSPCVLAYITQNTMHEQLVQYLWLSHMLEIVNLLESHYNI